MQDIEKSMLDRTKLFSEEVESLQFTCDCYIYNPLSYAWPMHRAYIKRYCSHPVPILLLGMNPGPFGMAQTGVPFGEVTMVREFLNLDEEIGKPLVEHPARPVKGLQTNRSEVSGKRLWGLLSEHYGSAQSLFSEMMVTNYCPLVFMDRGPTAKNITPDKLGRGERMALEAICDSYLLDVISLLKPTHLIGVGKYAKQKFEKVVGLESGYIIDSIIHPSPGNPQANKGWNEKTTAKLRELGIW